MKFSALGLSNLTRTSLRCFLPHSQATKIEQEIAAAFREMVNETLVDAKQQISMFEKLRLASDAAASELASLEKKAGTSEAKLIQARAVADQKRKEFLDMGEETREVLSQLHLALEAASIDLVCDYLEILSNSFNNAVRVSSEMVPLIFQTKTHIEEVRACNPVFISEAPLRATY